MGNEASLEGGGGGLPEGLSPGGSIPTEADLSQLGEEERRRLEALLSRAKESPRTPGVDANHQPPQSARSSPGPSGLSKSRTVDAFKTGPPARHVPPGRSPSSVSLLESRSREEPRSAMFSSGFLSGANPLSAVSSAVSKFSLFGDDEEEEAKKQVQQQQGPSKAGQGPSKAPSQQQGPSGPKPSGQQQPVSPKVGQPQQTGPQQGVTKPGIQPQQGTSKGGPQQQQQQGPAKGATQQQQGPPKGATQQQQGPPKGATQQQQGPPKGATQQQQGPPKGATQQQQGPPKGATQQQQGPTKDLPQPQQKTLCPVCKSTQLNLHTNEPANYNTCTECKSVVCSLCGFSPPDSAVKEWLCLNCQMQRALGAADLPGPQMMKPPKQTSLPSSPQKKPGPSEPSKPVETKKPPPLVKQQSTAVEVMKSAIPPSTPPAAQKAQGKGMEPSKETQKGLEKPTPTETQKAGEMTKGAPKPVTKLAEKTPIAQQPMIDPKPTHEKQEPAKPPQLATKGPGPASSPAKSTLPPKVQPAPKQESGFFGLSFASFTEAPKPQPTSPQPPESSGKMFGFGGFTETPKPQATTPQATESVSGKMFGFGSSIFSSASSLIGSAVQDESTAATTKDAQQPSKTSSATEAKASPIQKPEQTLQPKPPLQASQEKKPAPMKTDKPSEGAPRVDCPLCKVELNIGSKDPPNYNTCTECKKTVCNLCGFNPMPHLTGNDWLCLNCQTQRALAGQLGGMDPMSPPKLSPAKAPGQQPAAPKTQPSQVMQTKAQAEPSPPKPTSEQQKVEPPKAPSPPSATAKPSKGLTKMSSFDQSLASKPEKAKGVDPAASGNEKTSTVDAINTSVTPPEAPKKASSSQNALISPAPAEQHVSQSLKDGHRAAGLPPKASEEKILPKTQEKKMVEVQPLQKHVEVDTEKEKHRKEEKSHSTGSSQRKSPQGLSDTGYSSEGISGSLGEIPSVIPEKELLKEPIQKDTIVKESSPTSPSDLAKLERSVLPILEAQASTEKKEPSSEDREKRRRKLLPISPESFSSEEDFEDTQESESPTTGPPTDTGPTKDHRKTIETKEATSARKHRKDSIEDSSGSEPSPNLQRRRKVSAASSSSEEYKLGSPGSGDEEEFIRRQIMEMSADEDASGSDEENYVHKRIKEQEQKKDLGEIKDQDKNALGKSKHLLKKSKLCQEEEMEQREEKELKPKEGQYPKIRETKSEEAEETSPTSVGGLRRFKTIELNNTTATPYQGSPLQQGTEEGDDIESLTDSPEDRSKGEGSSSLHASSFTPGTSPTSVSSLDEDSDSSPSHKRVSGEAKHKKSRHRQPGQILPTIEDSSEEEEMREEEDILKEKEKHGYVDQHQVKKSNKKSKKDKEELRAQRRREYPKTPPSNLSPIEDASPTEELRQAAEMEELHKSSCSEYSPSIESEPEGFQIKTEKKDVPKVYQLPTSVSLYSPTDEQQLVISKGTIEKSLKSADEAYEEMMQKAKVIHDQKKKVALPEKESLYGGMLIEDYIYESLVEDSYEETVNKTYILQKKESSEILVKEPLKKLRSPDEVYEEMMQKKKAMMLEEEQIQKSKPKITNKEIIHKDTAEAAVPPIYESRHETALNRDRVSLKKDGKPLLDAEATYEELMKRQRVVLTPGTSPTQPAPGVIVISSSEDTEVAQGREHGPVSSPDVYLSRALYPIPDLKITQCSSGEDEVEDEENLTQQQEVTPSDIPQAVKGAFKQESVTTTAPSSSESTSNVEAATFTTSNESQTHAVVEAQVIHPIQAEPSFAVAKCSALAQHLPPDDEQGVTTASTKILVTTPAPPLQTQVTSRVPAYDSSQPVSSLRQASFAVPSFQTSPLPPPFFVDVAQSYNTPTVATQSAPVTAASPQFIPSVVVDIPQSVHDTTFSVPSVPVAPHEEASSLLSQVGHLVAQPKEEHVVISLPSLENIPVLHEIQQDPRVMSDTYSMIRASQVSSAPSPTASFPEHPFVGFSALPTLPQYAPSASTVISTAATAAVWAAPPPTSAPPVPPKPVALYRGSSLERTDAHVFAPPPPPPPPPLPPPTMPKPTIYPKKRLPVGMPPVMSSTVTMAHTILTSADQCTTVRSSMAPSYKPHVPPPVPPKPSSIPVGLVFSHKPGESVKPPVAPKPVVSQPCLNNQIVSLTQPRYVVPPSTTTMILNLTAPSECKLSSTSPKSPLSPKFVNSLQETYVVITLPSEPGSPVEGISTQAPTTRCLASPTKQPFQTTSAVPVTLTHYTKSIESQQVHAPEKLVSHTSRISCTVDPPPTSVSFVAQVMTTEVQRTTVSVVQERLPTVTPTPTPQLASISITRPQDLAKTQPKIEENGKIHYSGDVVDLRTMKVCVQKSGNGMDLTAPDCKRQVNTSESNGRQSSAVQPAVINLSGDTAPLTNVAVVTSSITIVTCTATVSQNFTAADRPLDLAHSTTVPLQLTTSKSFEPVAQIIYRPIDSQSVTSSIAELPINLSLSAITSTGISKTPVTIAPALSNGTAGFHAHMETESLAAVDLSTSKPVQTMVAVNGSLSAVVTSVIEEDDGKPVDLTAGKRAVCCDVVYKLPFAGSCTTQQAVTPLPEDRFGYRDDHYQYDRPGNYGMRSFGGMKPSMSDTNLAEAGLFFYKSKHSYDYNVTTEGAVDLTSGKISTGEIMDYSNKGTNAYSGLTIPPYCQARITPPGTHFGVSSVLRSSNGIVYSSVAAPVPSTYAITTQPGSIFSTTYKDLSGMHLSDTMPSLSSLQSQPLPRSYSFLSTTVTEQDEPICLETGISKEGLTSTFSEVTSTVTDSYTDASLEAIAASLEALASPMIPGGENSTYQIERELLELEKIKQLRLAEELEWERQEIQRFREQEQIIVQKELEELQSMKQQILCQQEEERQAHLMMQQETYAQQQLQLEQIHQLQQQLQQQLEEQKLRQLYPYGYEPSESSSPPTSVEQGLLDLKGDHGQYWPVQDETATSSTVSSLDLQQNATWYTVPSEGVAQYIQNLPGSEISLKEAESQEQLQLTAKKIVDSGVQTDDEDDVDRAYTSRRKRNKKSVDSSVQTDDEDQDEWDIPTRNRRRSRSSKYAEGDKGKQGSKVSSIAIQTVAEISVQTDSSGTIKKPSIKAQMDTTVEIVKHISAPEKTYRGGSLSCQTGTDSSSKDKRRPTPLEIGYNSHLKADSSLQVAPSPPKSPKVLYSPISPLSPSKSLEFVSYDKSIRDVSPQKVESFKPPPASPRTLQRSLSDPKPQSPTGDERTGSSFQYSDGYSGKVSTTPSGTQKKVKRTLPNPPPEEETAGGQGGYSTGSARRRLCRNTTMARAKILQDIDRELDLVERESSKLRKKQAELDEEEKEIDAKLRYLEMGINRRKDALLKEREKRERAYLQGVAEERDYMSDSEVSNIRETRGNGHGLERPRTAPQSEFNQFIPPQTQTEAQYVQQTRPYAQYPYTAQTQAATQYPQQTLYQQQSLYHQQVSPYQTQSIYSSVPTLSYPQATQQQNYQHATQLLLMQQKARQTTLSDLEPKITTNYEVVRNQSLMMAPSSTDAAYTVSHLGSKYSTLDLRMGLDERSSMASSPMSSISADSFYADIEHHTPRNYVLIDDIGELTKGSAGLSSSFTIPDKDLTKADRLLRSSDVRRSAGVTDFLGVSSRLHPYGKTEEDTMEEPYELKLLKQQIKQEFRRGTDGLDHLTGLPHYYPTDSYRPFPKTEKYSIGRLTLEKQAAKQLPASVLYQKQAKQKKTLLDPKITKFSPIQESRDLDPDYSSYLTSGASSVGGLASRARLLQDDITFGLRKNITEQQKYLGSTLGANLAQSLNLGQTLNLEPTMRSLQDDATYPSGSRSRPSSRPSSVYGLDLSLKRDLSSSSLRLKTDSDLLDGSYPSSSVRPKPTSLPISQSRGRIPIVAQNSEEESPLSPVGQPMGMARASAGPLPPISADSRDQFGSSHSLPEVQQHMREESRTRGYDRDIAFIMDDLQGAMSDSEALSDSLVTLSRDDPRNSHENIQNAYHLRREETDWFDKPREGRAENGHGQDRRQVTHRHGHQQGEVKPVQYCFPHIRLKLQRDSKDHSASGNGLGIRVVGGKEIPGSSGEMGAYIAKVLPGGAAEQTGKVVEGMQVLEWNGIPLICKTYEEVQGIVGQQCGEVEVCVRLDLNMLSDSDHPQRLELHDQTRAERQRSPGVDPKQLAAELQKVSHQQAPSAPTSTTEKPQHTLSGTTSAASSAVPSPGQPGSPAVSKKRHSSKTAEVLKTPSHPITGEMQLQINYDKQLGNLIVHVLQARSLAPRDNNGYSDPFVKVYLLPGRGQVMVVQNASAENKRRTKHMQKSLNPEWNQTVIYKNIHLEQLKKKTLEVTVWDYDRFSSNDFLGEVLIDLSNTAQLDNTPRWFPLKEQSESIDHSRTHSSQGSQQSPKTSVIKSRSHGIFPDPSKARPGHRPPDVPVTTTSSGGSSFGGSGFNLDLEGGTNGVDSAIFQVPRIGKTIPNGTDKARGPDSLGLGDAEGKTQVMGEIKIALKKEMKTEGEQLIVEILQCRNITYKFKSPDHLPDLYVKFYVVNVATQKRVIKKKTRVCRHDREPSFNETFRFNMNPAGHSIQLFLVSNGGKFMKKTLIGEAYIWLDKVDLRKRVVNWHKLLVSSAQTNP